jgi:hypothetical protein
MDRPARVSERMLWDPELTALVCLEHLESGDCY